MQNTRHKLDETLLTTSLVTVVLISNIIGAKAALLFGLSLPVGVFIFPVSYFFGSSLAEVYGYHVARRAILLALFGSLLFAVCAWIATALPSDPNWQQHEATYNLFLEQASMIVLGSLFAFLVGELWNAKVLLKLKTRWQGKRFSLRALIAMASGEVLSTFLMISIGFSKSLPQEAILKMAIHYYLFKVGFFFLLLPALSMLVKYLKLQQRL